MLFAEMIEVRDAEPHAGALNMAIDEVLLRTALAPALRVYRWARPAVSFGYFGKWREVARAWPQREAVRRWTGGGIVPHGEDFTYTLIVPRSCVFFKKSAPETYRAIHAELAEVLAETGGRPELALAAAEKSSACFEAAVPHDLLAGGRKIAGAAQRRTRAGLLHQGSIQGAAVAADFGARLAKRLGQRISSRLLTPAEQAEAVALAAAKYATRGWLERF